MSHYTEIELDISQKFEKQLIEALEDEFGVGSVEVNEQPKDMMGYDGTNRSTGWRAGKKDINKAPPCHIIIRRKYLGPVSNDIGFVRNKNGGFDAHIDDMNGLGSKIKNKVMREYAARVAAKTMKAKGYTVKRAVTKTGEVKLTCSKWS